LHSGPLKYILALVQGQNTAVVFITGARRCDIRRHHSWSPNPSPIHSLFYYKTYFAVLKGTHGSCIYIEIGINLDGSDAKAARLKQTAHAANRHPFSQARHDTTRYYNVFHDWRRGD
jgi:hypothetical protein